MDEIIDYWTQEDFEDTVAAGIISCYEGRIKKNRDGDNINDEHLKMFRACGPYFPSTQRVIKHPGDDIEGCVFDSDIDVLPKIGCYSFRSYHESTKDQYDAGYCQTILIRKVKTIGRDWRDFISGVHYEVAMLFFNNDKILGFKGFFTVSNSGLVRFCNKTSSNVRGYLPGVKQETISLFTHDFEVYKARQTWSFFGLQTLADRKFCWSITAKEKIAKAHLGCAQEEIKSLLYARTLPMTETGRKRPILHLVESHKRRMKNGIDIDISTFLRGQQTVEIGGTLFTVNPPASIYKDVTKQSQKKYYGLDTQQPT